MMRYQDNVTSDQIRIAPYPDLILIRFRSNQHKIRIGYDPERIPAAASQVDRSAKGSWLCLVSMLQSKQVICGGHSKAECIKHGTRGSRRHEATPQASNSNRRRRRQRPKSAETEQTENNDNCIIEQQESCQCKQGWMKATKEWEMQGERWARVGVTVVLSAGPCGAHFAPAGQCLGSKTIRAYA